jgi:hypothetical protein
MIQLPQITLIAVATVEPVKAVNALLYSCKGITFGAVKLVSHIRPEGTPDSIVHEYVDKFVSIDEWNRYIVYDLWKHVDTEFCILIHEDGFIVHPESFDPAFLMYDYCGPVWSMEVAIAIQGGRDQPLSRVGNSVSLRSRRLLKLPTDINLEWKRFNNDSNEDTFLTCHNRRIMEACGMRIAPVEVAMFFGREEDLPELQYIDKPFLFHKYHGRNGQYPRF